jgi:transcription elongation factor GreA
MPSDAVATGGPVVLTEAGRAWIQARHDRVLERRRRVEEEIANERTEELIEERRKLDEQAHELAVLLRDAVSPSDVIDDPSVVELGDEVEIEFPDGERETFLIVHPVEATMDDHRTSCEAPVARAVLGHRPGDRVTVTTPSGSFDCTILRRDRIG